MIRAILQGCYGQMGKQITAIAQNEVRIVAGIDKKCGQEKQGYPVFQSPADCVEEADVVIDFSDRTALDPLLEFCKKRKLPLVIGTTGHNERQQEQIKRASLQIPVLYAANLSPGIHLLAKLLKENAKLFLDMGYDVELIEKHHRQKADAPSGTALVLAEIINHEKKDRFHYQYDRSQCHRKREEDEIGILSLRGGTIVGEHEVIFAGEEEVVELRHVAYSKRVFAKGALIGAKTLVEKECGLYNMEDILEKLI